MALTNTKPVDSQNLTHQFLEVFHIVVDFIILNLRILYSIGDSVYNWFVPLPPKPVKGEIVLITGSGHGMGKELAILYASRGATVVGWDINTKNNEETMTEINQLGYPKAHAYYCDVSNREKVFEVAKKVQQDVGDVTILINNAGIMPTHPIMDQTKEEIERVFGINVLAHCWTIQAFLPSMRQHNHGYIVALSSAAGLMGLENLVPYCGSKFAVFGMMEALGEELRLENVDGIYLTTVCPYMVDTGLCKKPRIRFEKAMPLLKPKDVAMTIIDGQQTNKKIVCVPSYLLTLNNYVRLLPHKAGTYVKDFLNAGVDSDL